MSRLILVLYTLLASAALSAQVSRPNVVLIMTDDVGYGDFGFHGATDIRTPVLDRMAREGVRFTDFYSNGATCSPTRAGLITGRYQQRYGIEAPLPSSDPEGRTGLPVSGHSLPQLMKDAGYRTGLIGKWHLGLIAARSPRAHGFEHFFGFKSGYVDYYTHNSGSGEPDLWLNDEPTTQDGYLTDLITAHSVDFIRANSNRPFFLSVQYSAAHWPYQVPDQPSVAIRNAAHLQPHEEGAGTRAQYAAMLERADQGIGQILAALQQAGIDGNTLVIFTNDNGGEWLSRNVPLFHRKWSVWEGGIRVPAIMRWPGVIPPGQVTPQVGITMDFTATLLALAGARLPAGHVPEGIDLLPIVTGRSPVVERTLFWRANASRAVRRGDLKLVVDSGSTFVFDVRKDPGERSDLTNTRQQDAARLRGLLDAWVADVDAERQVRAPTPAGRARTP
jgi:arylsulfatase A-like enzyme